MLIACSPTKSMGFLRSPLHRELRVRSLVGFMIGNVEESLLEQIRSEGSIHMTLIDPEKTTPSQASRIAAKAGASETSAIMIGGSTFVS